MSAVLRLKMYVQSVKTVHGTDGQPHQEEIDLRAVYDNHSGSANAQWSKWTPDASLKMSISNTGAFGKVLPGQFLFVDLTLTDKDSLS